MKKYKYLYPMLEGLSFACLHIRSCLQGADQAFGRFVIILFFSPHIFLLNY